MSPGRTEILISIHGIPHLYILPHLCPVPPLGWAVRVPNSLIAVGFSFLKGSWCLSNKLPPFSLAACSTVSPPLSVAAAAACSRAPSVPGMRRLARLQAHSRGWKVVLTLPFCLLFTIFPICPLRVSSARVSSRGISVYKIVIRLNCAETATPPAKPLCLY